MPQSSEPYKFVASTSTDVPGIPQEKDDPIYPTTEGSAAAHNLQNQPILFDGTTYGTLNTLGANYFDNVYMPQPKTRELDHPNNACSSNCTGPNDGSNPTYDDDYRYWPAKRDRDGGIIGTIYTSTINAGPGCSRYESLNQKSSDEGHWHGTYGSHYAHTGHYLGSPAYKTVYWGTPDDNSFLNGSNFTTADYISDFLSKFAPGYSASCCTNTVVDARHLDDTTIKWGDFGANNIRYGIHYYDDYDGGLGCGGDGGGDCCSNQTCGIIFRPQDIATDQFVEAAPGWRVGGLKDGTTADTDAARNWLDSTLSTHWVECDVYNSSEPTQASNNPPGKFGVVDNTRTNRQYNVVRCMQDTLGDPSVAENPDSSVDASERCTKGCLDLSPNPTWFVNEGKTYTSSASL